MWQGGGVLLLSLKMSQNSIDDILLLDTGDDSDRSAAAGADLDVYIEHALEPLSPSHGGMALGGGANFCVGDRLDAFPTPGWRDQPTPAVVWSENAMVAGEVDPRLRHQCRQSRTREGQGRQR